MEAPADAAAVALRDVRKVYGEGEGEVVALDGISIALARGSFTAIMGPSGSGKSTFLHLAAGLDRPTSGTVALGDTELAGLNERRLTILRRERIGFVFQAFNLMPSLTVTQNIGLPLRLDGRRPRRSQVREVAARVGLDQRLRHRPVLFGGSGTDRLFGSAGDDTVNGDRGDDDIFFGDGNDRAIWDPGDGSDRLEGRGRLRHLRVQGQRRRRAVPAVARRRARPPDA